MDIVFFSIAKLKIQKNAAPQNQLGPNVLTFKSFATHGYIHLCKLLFAQYGKKK